MNQISLRLSSLCRSSSPLLRKSPFIRFLSSKAMSSSSNLIQVFSLKLHHHTFNYTPPSLQISGNDIRKLSGEAAKCNFRDDDYLKNEIQKIQDEQSDAECSIESGDPPLDAVEIRVDKFNALMEKIGLPTLDDNEKEAGDDYDDDYPPHLQRFRKEIEDLVESVEMTVAFGEFVAAGGEDRWDHFEYNYWCMLKYRKIVASLQQMKIRSRLMRELLDYPSQPQIRAGNHNFMKLMETAAGCSFGSYGYIKNEIEEVEAETMCAQIDVERGRPPLRAANVLADKFNDLMKKLGLEGLDDDEIYGPYPPHLWGFRKDIEGLVESVDMTVAFGEYVAAGGSRCWQPFMGNYRCMIKYEEILASLRQMKIRSKPMRRLIKAESDFQSTVVAKGTGCT